jgi:dipeptidyl aminopeptidase/acylaminoacyl peptidase
MGLGLALSAGRAGVDGAWAQPPAAPELPPLIPRSVLFGNPERIGVQLSPDGRSLGWLAPHNGVLNVFVAPVGDPAAVRAVTSATRRRVYYWLWAYDSRTIVYGDDAGGDENFRVYAVDTATLARRDLTPLAGVRANILGLRPEHPDLLAVGLNDRDPAWHDVWHVDLATGERRLVRENRDRISSHLLDQDLVPRLAVRNERDGSAILHAVGGERLEVLEPLLTIPFADVLTTAATHLTADGKAYYLRSSIGRDRAALFRVDRGTGARTLVAEHDKADVGGSGALLDPSSREVTAVAVEHVRREWIDVDPAVGADLALIGRELDADVSVVSQTQDGTRWIVASNSPERATIYHLFERGRRRLARLFAARPQLARYTLAPMHGRIVRSRDGLDLVSYVTLPAGERGPRPMRPLPMVLVVHGGPWSRDGYGYHSWHQWLANRGYAVLSVNFRGSTGFGKAFVNAGDLEWGGRMHDDLIDAVAWAARDGIAEPGRVAIMGASYGGYAALVGATLTPEAFRCAVSIVGPSNLETLLATIPPYWAPFFETFARRVGDPRTEAGRALLRARSPLTRAGAISRPLLVLQGANDQRVKQAESDQIVAAVRARGLPVTYVLYSDEGHGFLQPANQVSSMAIVEAFLARHLGGRRFEAIAAGDLAGSTLRVQGAEHVPGLEAALAARR